jgi:dTDP-4-dehydrorhamnose reductase
MMKRLAVVGASGLLGQYVASEAIERGYEVLGTYLSEQILADFEKVRMDIREGEETAISLGSFSPDVVVLTAAMTNVDECERKPEAAWKANVEGTMNVTRACREMGVPLLYVSTDYVFNGMNEVPYAEADPPDPLGTYARTKLEGERLVLNASRDNLVCRVSVVYGWNRVSTKNNFVTWVIESLRAGKRISLFSDQWASPTYAPFCARLLLDLLSKKRGKLDDHREERGIFHTSGRQCLDRYAFGLRIAEVFGLDDTLIKGVEARSANLLAERPMRSCLSVRKVEAELNMRIPSIEESLEHMQVAEV